MPIYEYLCEGCGHQLEMLQSAAESPLQRCPNCNEDTLLRVISGAAFHLKGGGWYKDGYASAKPATPPTGGKDE